MDKISKVDECERDALVSNYMVLSHALNSRYDYNLRALVRDAIRVGYDMHGKDKEYLRKLFEG